MGAAFKPADQPLSGVWRGVATVQGAPIPFRLRLEQHGGVVRANFFDGERPTNASAPGTLAAGRLHLSFPSYGATLDAVVGKDRLDGTYVRNAKSIAISATKGGGAHRRSARRLPSPGSGSSPASRRKARL